MLRFLQKRKFRLVTRWKAALKDNIGFQLPARQQFPYALIFRAFDELVRLLKCEPMDRAPVQGESFLSHVHAEIPPSADQYMELFLTGRDVLGDFLETDRAFCSLFKPQDRQNLHSAMEQAFKLLIEHEMNEHTLRSSSILPG